MATRDFQKRGAEGDDGQSIIDQILDWFKWKRRREGKKTRDQFSDPSCDDSEDAASVPVLVQSPRPGGKERDGMRNDLKLPSLKCQVSGWLTRCFQNWQPPTILPSTAVYL